VSNRRRLGCESRERVAPCGGCGEVFGQSDDVTVVVCWDHGRYAMVHWGCEDGWDCEAGLWAELESLPPEAVEMLWRLTGAGSVFVPPGSLSMN
jgi:hypothetical protein